MTTDWHKVAEVGGLDDGRVRAVTVDRRTIALCRVGEQYSRARQSVPAPGRTTRRRKYRERLAALSLARLRLRPTDRSASGGIGRRCHLLSRRVPRRRRVRRTTAAPRRGTYRLGLDCRDPRRLGDHPRVRNGRALEPRSRRCTATRRATRRHHLHRDSTRGGSVVRGVGLCQAHRPPRCMRGDCRTRLDQSAHRVVRRKGRPRSRGVGVGPGSVEGARARRLPRPRPRCRVCRRRPVQPRHPIGFGSFRTDGTGSEARARRPHRDTPDRARRGAGAAGTDVDGERSHRADRRSPRRPTGRHAAAGSGGHWTGDPSGHDRRAWCSRCRRARSSNWQNAWALLYSPRSRPKDWYQTRIRSEAVCSVEAVRRWRRG